MKSDQSQIIWGAIYYYHLRCAPRSLSGTLTTSSSWCSGWCRQIIYLFHHQHHRCHQTKTSYYLLISRSTILPGDVQGGWAQHKVWLPASGSWSGVYNTISVTMWPSGEKYFFFYWSLNTEYCFFLRCACYQGSARPGILALVLVLVQVLVLVLVLVQVLVLVLVLVLVG